MGEWGEVGRGEVGGRVELKWGRCEMMICGWVWSQYQKREFQRFSVF